MVLFMFCGCCKRSPAESDTSGRAAAGVGQDIRAGSVIRIENEYGMALTRGHDNVSQAYEGWNEQ